MKKIEELDEKTKIRNSFIFETIYYIIFALAILMKGFYFQFICRLNYRPLTHIVNIKLYFASFGMLLIIMAVCFFLFNKKRLIAFFVLDIFLTILIFADMLYFKYFANAITIPVIMQIGVVSSLGDSIKNLIGPKDLIMLIDIPILIFGIFYIHKLGVNKIHILKRLLIAVIAVAIGLVSIYVPLKNTGFKMASFDKNMYIKSMGILYFHKEDVVSFVNDNLFKDKSLTPADKDKLQTYFTNNKSKTSYYKGIATGKNLIVVQMEALQSFLVNRKINGKEITPNLNKLIKDSLYFDNFYFQAGRGKTSDAEFILNNSLQSVTEGAAYFKYPSNKYYTLPKVLKDSGYKSYVMHAYDPSFYNRTFVYRNFGYDRFFSKPDFIKDEIVGWGLSDTSFYRQCLDNLEKSTNPYFGFLISLSAHYPFDDFRDFAFDVGDLQGTFLGDYIKAENYADKCLGDFIADLKRRNLYNNTLLVFYGDHFGIPKLEAGESLMKFMGVENNEFEWTKLQKVPLIIHYPNVKSGVVSNTTGGQVDIMPTISNLLGIKTPYALGNDLLNNQKGYVVLRDSTVITDEFIYFASSDKLYDIKTGKPILKSSDNYMKYLEELEISDLIIQKDAFSKWELK